LWADPPLSCPLVGMEKEFELYLKELNCFEIECKKIYFGCRNDDFVAKNEWFEQFLTEK
jgi:hypothetical protein